MLDGFRHKPLDEAIRELAERSIVAIEEGRDEEMPGQPAPWVTLGCLWGPAAVSVDDEEHGYGIIVSEDQNEWDALIALLASVRRHHFSAGIERRECICRTDR